ncbi:MAG: WD40 repeat domain-containing protein, partial [Anaerolineales bacterium]
YRGSVSSVNYSPDGNTAVLGVLDGSVRLLDLETGDELGRFLHRPPFVAAELSPDGREALWMDEAGNLVLLDLEDRILLRTFDSAPDVEGDYSHAVSALAFHSDGIHALSGHVDGSITFWDLETGGQVGDFGYGTAAIEELLVISDGSQFLSANANGEVALWDLEAEGARWRYQPESTGDQVYRFAFLPNKAQALFGTLDGGLILWDLDSGEQIARLGSGGSTQGHAGWVSALAVSPDGQLAVSGGTHGRLILWDLESGQEIHRFDEVEPVSRRSPVLSLDLSGDGTQVIAGYENGALKLWDLHSGELLQSFSGNFWNVEGVDLFPDNQSALATTIDGGLHRWDIAAGGFERLFDGPIAGWVEVTPSQDGRLVISLVTDIIHITDLAEPGQPEDLLLWDLQSRQLLQRLSGVHEAAVVDAELSPDGRWALSGDARGGLVLWDLDNGGAVYTIPSDGHYVLDIAFSPDGSRALTSSNDDEDGIVLWDVSTGDVLGNFPVVLNGESLVFSPDGRMAYAGLSNGEIQVWDAETGQELDLLAGHTNLIYDLDLSADGRRAISAAEDGIIRVWNLDLGPRTGSLVSPEYQLGLAISPDGERALTGAGGGLLEWDLESAQLIRKLEGGHEQPVFDVVISPDGRQAVSSAGDPFAEDGGSLALWDLGTGSMVRRLDWETQIYLLAITPDGRYAVVTSNFTDEVPGLFLWDLETGEVVDRFQIESVENISAVALSPDGGKVLIGVLDRIEGDWVRLWDIETGELLESFPGHETAVIDMAFLPDGKRAVSVSWDRSLILWDIESGEMVRRMSGQNTELFSVAVDPSGRYALTGTGDGRLILWDLDSGEAIRNFKAHNAPVAHVTFSPQGDWVLTNALDGAVHIWQVHRTLDELVDWVQENRYVRQLTCAERDLYGVQPLCTP